MGLNFARKFVYLWLWPFLEGKDSRDANQKNEGNEENKLDAGTLAKVRMFFCVAKVKCLQLMGPVAN